MWADIKKVARGSVVYGLGSLGIKVISFLLIPVYTHYLTTADYGIMAVTGSLTAVLGIIFPLALPSAVSRFYFNPMVESERRSMIGSVWAVMILMAVAMGLGVDLLGRNFLTQLFPDVAYDPYIRLAIWGAVLVVPSLIPLALFQVQERPFPYVLLSNGRLLLMILLTILGVVVFRKGAYGALWAIVGSGLLMLGPCLWLTLKQASLPLRWSVIGQAFAFSLPLIPHNIGTWILELSDRAILARFVSLNDLGIYSLGYQFGMVLAMVAASTNSAWIPFMYRTLESEGDAGRVRIARLMTYFLLAMSGCLLIFGFFIKEVVSWMTAPAFHEAYRVASVVAFGQFLQVVYFVFAGVLFFSKRTAIVPVITVLSGLLNVGCNLLMIPLYGILAAAWATVAGYAFMSLATWIVSVRLCPFPYETRRIGLLLAWTAITYLTVSSSVAIPGWFQWVIKALLLAGFLMGLWFSGFFDPREKQALKRWMWLLPQPLNR